MESAKFLLLVVSSEDRCEFDNAPMNRTVGKKTLQPDLKLGNKVEGPEAQTRERKLWRTEFGRDLKNSVAFSPNGRLSGTLTDDWIAQAER